MEKEISKAILSGEFAEMEEEVLETELGGRESRLGSSFLHIAAKTGDKDIVKNIINAGIDINITDSAGNTPLHYAAINSWTDIAALLIDNGADVNVENKLNQTPLHFAVQAIASVNKNIPSIVPLNGSVTSNFGIRKNPFSDKYQFHRGVDIGAPIGAPIKAAANGKVIKHGWFGVFGNVIIIEHENNFITVYGHCKEVKVRKGNKVAQGEIIAFVGQTGLATGAHCHYEVRNNNIATNPLPYTHISGSNGAIEVMKLLLNNNADTNVADKFGKIPLHYAATRSAESVSLLLSKNSTVNRQDYRYGFTPLHYAVLNSNAAASRLLNGGARVNVKSKNTFTTIDGKYYSAGSTPLAIAMKNESLETAKLLLKWGGVE
ncbi:MAG: ankyrin repeat domain-containing protein [Leptospirales bacterium]|nr:ankyrin repeat domain-containing protein [Leptospirales bacterium]